MWLAKEAPCVHTRRKCIAAPAWVSTFQSGHALTIWGPPPFFWILNVTNKGFKQGPGVNVSSREGKSTLIRVIRVLLVGKYDFCVKVWSGCLLNGMEGNNGERIRWAGTAHLHVAWRHLHNTGSTSRMLFPMLASLKGYSGRTWASFWPLFMVL